MEIIKSFILMGRGGLLTSTVLDQLIKAGIQPTAVIIEKTDYDSNFPNLTENLCVSNGIPYIKSNINDEETISFIGRFKPEMIIVASLGKILKQKILETSKFINVHMGTLPSEKGAHTVFWNILNNSDSFGISIHEMTESIDEGKLFSRQVVSFSDVMDGFELHKKLYREAGIQLCNFLESYPQSLSIVVDTTNEEGNYLPKFDPKYLLLDINQPFNTLVKKINRLQYYGYPRIELNGTIHEITHAAILQSDPLEVENEKLKIYSDDEVLFLEQNTNVIRLTTNNGS